MRIIDADKFIENLKKAEITEKVHNKIQNYGAFAILPIVQELLDKEPTVFEMEYDVDWVVKQIEELPRDSHWDHNSDNVNRKKVIEIVKKGGNLDE